jgi:competence protein ComEC
MRSPLTLALGFFAGLALGLASWSAVTRGVAGLLGLGLGTAVALGTDRLGPGFWRRLAPAVLGLAAFAAGLGFVRPAARTPLPPAGMARLEVEVEAVNWGAAGQAWSLVRVLTGQRLADGVRVAAGTRLSAGPFPLPAGARLRVLGNIQPRAAFRNLSPAPPLSAAESNQGRLILSGTAAFEVLATARWGALLARLRDATRRRLDATLSLDAAAVVRALLLGDMAALERRDNAAVRAAGLSHVFAVSGMHVTLLAGLTIWLLTRGLLRLQPFAAAWNAPRLAAGLGIPLALFIAAFTGGSPSGWRASITTALMWLVVACGRRPEGGAVTAAACLLFGACAPADALRPAFLLSVAATVALLTRPLPESSAKPANTWAATLRDSLVLTLRTSLATAPLVWWSFGSLPIVGLFANVLLVPLGSVLLLCAAAHVAVMWLLPPLAAGSGAILAPTARAFLEGCAAFDRLDPHYSLPPLSLPEGLLLTFVVSVLLFARSRQRQALALAAAALLGLGLEIQLRHEECPRDRLRVSFVDVGQGDATLIDLPDGRLMLIDAGGAPHGGPDPGAQALVPLLRARRRERIDVVVLTHPHPDHYGGLGALLDAFPIGELWDSGQSVAEAERSSTAQQALALVERARHKGTRVRLPEELCGKAHAFGSARVEVLWPCPAYDPGYEANDNSLVLRLEYGARRLLFTGDIEAHAEAALAAGSAELRADVLKVAHHGSRTSSNAEVLAAIAPRLAFISAGVANPFGHPHPEALARLRAQGAEVIDLGERGGAQLWIEEQGQMELRTSEP